MAHLSIPQSATGDANLNLLAQIALITRRNLTVIFRFAQCRFVD